MAEAIYPSTLLTRYITDKPFTIADTVYAKARSLRPYSRYIRNRLIYNTAMFFVSSKKGWTVSCPVYGKEKFRPKKTHHFNGDTYVLTAGQTFSAGRFIFQYGKRTTKRNTGGEETGGGWHGNNGVLIPEIRLPNTRLRLRLPLYRLVQFNHVPKNGTGFYPMYMLDPTTGLWWKKRPKDGSGEGIDPYEASMIPPGIHHPGPAVRSYSLILKRSASPRKGKRALVSCKTSRSSVIVNTSSSSAI